MSLIATVVFVIGIAGLFWLNRNPAERTSAALWIPVAWLLIVGSRPVTAWLQGGGPVPTVGFEDGSPLDRNIYLVLLFLAIGVLVSRGPAVSSLLRQNWALLAFVGYCAVSVLWSSHPEVASKRWIKSLGDVAMVLIIWTDPNRKSAIKRFLARVGFVLLPWSILLIKYFPNYGRAYSQWEGTAFYVGVASDKNMLGMTCMIFGLGAAWRFLIELRGAAKRGILLVHGTVFCMALWLISTANSMTSLSCFLFGVFLMVAAGSRRFSRKALHVHLLLWAGLIASSSILFLNVGGGVLSAMGRNATLTGRTDLWPALLRIDNSPLLGSGYESFWSPEHLEQLVPVLHWIPNEAHNGYLEIYLNLGWLGILVFSLLIFSGYRSVFQSLARDPEIGRLKLAFFGVGLAYSFTEAGFRNLTPIWIAFLLATLKLPFPRAANKMQVSERSNPRQATPNLEPAIPQRTPVSCQPA